MLHPLLTLTRPVKCGLTIASSHTRHARTSRGRLCQRFGEHIGRLVYRVVAGSGVDSSLRPRCTCVESRPTQQQGVGGQMRRWTVATCTIAAGVSKRSAARRSTVALITSVDASSHERQRGSRSGTRRRAHSCDATLPHLHARSRALVPILSVALAADSSVAAARWTVGREPFVAGAAAAAGTNQRPRRNAKTEVNLAIGVIVRFARARPPRARPTRARRRTTIVRSCFALARRAAATARLRRPRVTPAGTRDDQCATDVFGRTLRRRRTLRGGRTRRPPPSTAGRAAYRARFRSRRR
mmetsp:Transcript_14891/g.51870  ORF Transcript_14891/g.51870 Transcript_14891/m.51870 type:complete len:298 (-) Transcript_14891:880-1773(-)